MKKYLILLMILTSMPVFATCSIEDGASCKVAELMRQPINRTMNRTSSVVKEFTGKSDARLQPRNNYNGERQLRDFGPQKNDYSYSSNCQFGRCDPDGAPKLFQRRQ